MQRIILIAVVWGVIAVTLHAQTLRTGGDGPVFVEPTRRAPAGTAEAPPPVPAEVDRLPPATLDLVIVRTPPQGSPRTTRQTLTREPQRAHLAAGSQEWLFERNGVDGRRVSAWLIDHANRAIVFHDESDLRNRLSVRGWADVVGMGQRASFTTPAGVVRVTVARERPAVDRTRFAPPAARFPAYAVVDLAEWLEGK